MAAAKKDKSNPPATPQYFPIVGVGASAGGLDAFKSLLKAIPEDSGMAYVLVQHLDPSHESMLPDILSRVTKIPVYEITDDIHLAPNHIYIIPSNKILTSTDGVLKLATRDKKILTLSIDIFFKSLADVHKEFAIGVLLSGTGSDGTLGLKSIKEHGGISIAQDQESAAYDSMPQNAINAGVVDFILAPEKIPAQLLQISSSYKTNHAFIEEGQLPKDDEDAFKQILLLLHKRSGVDFTYYKQPTFHRRIARRIAIAKKKNLADYLKFLRTDKAEQDALFLDVLIPVTSFFRDPKAFNVLRETVFPVIFKNKSSDEPIRVWIAGCSTGEEAFSIAISLHEFLREILSDTRIQIFASDISESAIKKARAAVYSKADVHMLSETQLKIYFIKSNGGYEVNKLIRDMCVFAPHNFLKDPPFAKMDLISCRNVLIYMDTFLQKKALTTFHYALKGNGFLLLGKSESTSPASELFTLSDKHEKIYTRKPVPGRFIHVVTERKENTLATKENTVFKQEPVFTDLRKSAEAILLSKYTPASVVVNEQMDIVHIHGIITPFLEAPQGKPTFNLLKMARGSLAFELRNALHKAKTSKVTIIKENIPFKENSHRHDETGLGNQSFVTIEIMPLTNTVEPNYLILFTRPVVLPDSFHEAHSGPAKKNNEANKFIQQLEKELALTREDMRSITEDMEAANEELQSSNEELQSSNEEMQSLNEELETSKEELQSTNEELIIVNHELTEKQEQLNTARLYAENIITTIREPLIILDKYLRIKTANDAFYKVFKTSEEETEGRLLYEVRNHQWDDDGMRSLLGQILPKKEKLEDYEIILRLSKHDERNLLLNARQIINEKTSEQLILLAIEDITERKITEKLLRESQAQYRQFLDNSPVAVYSCDKDGYILLYNTAAVKLWGREPVTGKEKWCGSFKIFDSNGIAIPLDECPMAIALKGGGISSPELVLERPDGTRKYVIPYPSPIYNSKGNISGAINTLIDITEQVNTRKKIEAIAVLAERGKEIAKEERNKAQSAMEAAENAMKSKQQFLSNMSHEIRTPMNAIIGFTKVLLRTDLSSKQEEYISAIKTSGDTLIFLINDILDLAKVDAGKMVFMQTPFKMAVSITTMLHLFETKISEKNLKLIKEYDARIPDILLGDSIRLHQIILNLMSNALKFTSEGSITMRVSLLEETKEQVTVDFSITDTGSGIAEEDLEQIFENFQQATGSAARLSDGTGLGLAIVKQLVEKQGGSIKVKSKINEGSTFSFILAFSKTDAIPVLETGMIEVTADGKNIRILVVEDVTLNQLLIKTILDDFGFSCDITANGKTAIEKLQTNTYDIILMDLQMPVMNGFEATEHIRNTMHLKIPIMALTADVTTMDVAKCKAIGMNDYIAKPIDERLLYKKIVVLLGLASDASQ